MVKDSH